MKKFSNKSSSSALKESNLDAFQSPFMSATYKLLSYTSKSASSLVSPKKGQLALVEYIETHFEIPPDFESNTTRYGPLSGVSYVERLISAYEWRLLQGFFSPVSCQAEKMCWKCESKGSHFAREGCPFEV